VWNIEKAGYAGHAGVGASFHSGMKGRVKVDRELLKEIEMTNGLLLGCTMTPTLCDEFSPTPIHTNQYDGFHNPPSTENFCMKPWWHCLQWGE